jgi:endonuclease/exonuclease/phosphatase family metal-dependent hydrolase
MGLKIQTFNCFGPAYAPRLVFRSKMLCDYLKANDPLDICFFQEVWKESHYKIIHKLFYKEQADLGEFYFDTLTPKNKKTGMLVYYRGDLISSEYIPFSINESNLLDKFRNKIGILKGIGHLELHRADLGSLHVINIHTHPTSAAVRISQIVEIIAFVKSLKNANIIIAGDFNMEPSSVEYKLLLSSLACEVVPTKPLVGGELSTYSRKNPYAIPGLHKLVDYIFLQSDNLVFSAAKINMQKHLGYHLSDHYGVYAEISEEKSTPKPKLDSPVKDAIDILSKCDKNKFAESIRLLESFT